jgi:hypothetical protein
VCPAEAMVIPDATLSTKTNAIAGASGAARVAARLFGIGTRRGASNMRNTKRSVLFASIAALGLGIFSALAEEASAVPPPFDPSALLPSELIMHSTVEIRCPLDTQHTSQGTGFFFSFFAQPTTNVLALVTNKHVLGTLDENYTLTPFSSCNFTVTGTHTDGSVDYSKHIDINITDMKNRVVAHTDKSVDLAILIVGDLISAEEKSNGKIFFSKFDQSLIPNEQTIKSLTPLEDVLTVGYPADFWDRQNNLPIFHRASTATPPYIDFQGRKEFVVDTTEWFGASGSPVLVYNPSGWVDQRKHINNMSQGRILLMGVVYGVANYDLNGTAQVEPVPTSALLATRTKVPINASVCINSSRILEFEPILASMGVQVPQGYNMRAKHN